MARTKPTEREGLEPPRMEVPAGRAVARTRDGRPVYRRITADSDQFAIPEEIKSPEWSFEWKRRTLFGQVDRAYEHTLTANGWEFVKAGDYPGMFYPPDHNPDALVERGDLVLMVRSSILTNEARAEERKAANEKLRTAVAQHGLGGKLPNGYEADRRNTGVGSETFPVNVVGEYDMN